MTASKKAKRYTTVGGRTFAPGDSVPGDLVDLIDNPKVWEANEGAQADDGGLEEGDSAQEKSASKSSK